MDKENGGNNMLLINKGSSIGWTAEDLEKNEEVLGLYLISILDCILTPKNKEAGKIAPKNYGLIEEAANAMYHDIHGLAILADMIDFVFKNRREDDLQHKDFLYVIEIIEKYFTNIRSIYDFMSKVSRLAVEERYLGQISFDSLNGLITFSETPKTQERLPSDLIALFTEIKTEFHLVRGIRDVIVHNGKQITLMTDHSGYLLGPFDKDGALLSFSENSFEDRKYEALLTYLSDRTYNMIAFGS
jgi:hypothetical protein